MAVCPAHISTPSPTHFTGQISELADQWIGDLLNIKKIAHKITEFTIIIIIIINIIAFTSLNCEVKMINLIICRAYELKSVIFSLGNDLECVRVSQIIACWTWNGDVSLYHWGQKRNISVLFHQYWDIKLETI
jgi:hypothetical protein